MTRKQGKQQSKTTGTSKKNDDQTKPNGQIIAAIITVIGVIFVGLLNFPPVQKLFDVTTTPTSAMPTTITATIHPTDSNQPSTSMLSPIPSSTPSPIRATLFEDTFIDNRNRWYTASKYPNITGGKYTHKVMCPVDYASYNCGTYLEIPFDLPKNFKIEIDTTIIESSNDADVGVSFQIRRNNENLYYINYFITQSYYQLSLAYKGDVFRIIPDTTSNFIQRELGDTNKFGIEIIDALFIPYINGQEMPKAEDGNLIGSGKTFLVIYVSRGHSAILQFDNFIVQEVK